MSTKAAPAFSSVVPLVRTDTTSPRLTLSTIIASDILAFSLLYWLVLVARHLISPHYTFEVYSECFPILALLLAAFWIDDLYPGVLIHPAEEMRRVVACVSVVFLVFSSFTFVSRSEMLFSRSIYLMAWVMSAPVVLAFRSLTRNFCKKRAWWGYSAVVLGSGPAAQRVVRSLRANSPGLRITGVLLEDQVEAWPNDMPVILGQFGKNAEMATGYRADLAILAVTGKSSTELRQAIQHYCNGFQRILLLPDLPGICSMGIVAREVGGELGFEVPQRLFNSSARVTKRLADFVFSLVILLTLSPVLLAIAILIKAGSKGPLMFGHRRQGRDGEEFLALKFRTMVPDAESVLAAYLKGHPEHRAEWERDHKLKNDPRVTAFGKWLRRYSFDELPQLWNVLRGEMSLVGPRPIVKAEIPRYGTGYELYMRVLPGLTGLWQVSGRNNTTYDERVAFDEYYVRNWSVWFDVYILVRTVKVVLTGEGAY